MTLEERIAALEEKTQEIERHVWVDTKTGQSIPYLLFRGIRLGVNTDFWAKQDLGEGAIVSAAGGDRFIFYGGADQILCQDNPTIVFYAEALKPNPQMNIGFFTAVGNSAKGNYSVWATHDDVSFGLRKEGLEVIGNALSWCLGKVGGLIKTLWP